MCSKQAIFCISKNKIPQPLEDAKTAWREAAFMKHFTKPFYLYFFFSQIFIISQNCCKSAETTAISRILGLCSDIYTVQNKTSKKIKCAALLIQAKAVLHFHNCPQDNYYILQLLNESYWNIWSQAFCSEAVWHSTVSSFVVSCALFKMPRQAKGLKSGENFKCWKHIWKQIWSNKKLKAEHKEN